MSQLIDLVNKRFGRWLVLERAANKGKQSAWLCRCDCGKIAEVHGCSLKAVATKSCGCLRVDVHTKHGEAKDGMKTPEYGTWAHMINRCHNQNDSNYFKYGNRGIFVCDEWKNSFLAFLRDMGRRPSKDMTIERVDNNAGYYKENCLWGNKTEQQLNQRIRSSNTTGVVGVSHIPNSYGQKKWCATLWVGGIVKLHKKFLTKEEAIAARLEAEEKYHKPLRLNVLERLAEKNGS
jgi:hypothetical protein